MTLKPCPDSPNCVSTQVDPSHTGHYMEPVSFTGDATSVIEAIIDTVSSNGGKVTESTESTVDALLLRSC